MHGGRRASRRIPNVPAYVADTNFYIRAFGETTFGHVFRRWHAEMLPRLALSAVVLHELLVGATDRARRYPVERLYAEAFRRRGRLLVPSVAVWVRAAEADRKLRQRGGYGAKLDQRGFAHDLLIALTCREIGATLITENARDFSIIAGVTGVRYVTGLPEPANL